MIIVKHLKLVFWSISMAAVSYSSIWRSPFEYVKKFLNSGQSDSSAFHLETSLPSDIFQHTLLFLNVDAAYAVACTCKKLNQKTKAFFTNMLDIQLYFYKALDEPERKILTGTKKEQIPLLFAGKIWRVKSETLLAEPSKDAGTFDLARLYLGRTTWLIKQLSLFSRGRLHNWKDKRPVQIQEILTKAQRCLRADFYCRDFTYQKDIRNMAIAASTVGLEGEKKSSRSFEITVLSIGAELSDNNDWKLNHDDPRKKRLEQLKWIELQTFVYLCDNRKTLSEEIHGYQFYLTLKQELHPQRRSIGELNMRQYPQRNEPISGYDYDRPFLRRLGLFGYYP
ncbi:MAG: hypothetical protein WB791_02820 [Waddliaceae bacterium]